MRRLSILVAVLALCVYSLAQTQDGVDAADQVGITPLGTYHGSAIDNVDVYSGNLHIEIPLVTLKGRGFDTRLRLIYNSIIWHAVYDRTSDTYKRRADPDAYQVAGLGWNLTYAADGGRITNWVKTITNTTYGLHEDKVDFVDPSGAKHTLFGTGGVICSTCFNTQYESADLSYIHLNSPGWMNFTNAFLKNGTKFFLTSSNTLTLADTNGNYLDRDSLGRAFSMSPASVQSSTLSYSDSDGNPQTLSFTYTTCQPPNTGAVLVYSLLASVTLPTGAGYSFQYNTKCELTKMTLPSGGYIRYEYNGGGFSQEDYVDDGAVTKRAISIDGVTEQAYAYAIIVGGVNVVDPLGNIQFYQFSAGVPGVQNRGLVSQIQFKNAAGAVLRTISKTYAYDSSLFNNTVQGGNPRLASEIVTLENGQQSQTTYTYDSYGNLTQKLEYDFGAGAPGALLCKTTYTYLHNGNSTYLNAHILDRNTSVSVYSPAGVLLSQTYFDYDSTAPTATTNATAHDYTDYPSTYNVRGNLTRKREWLNSTGAYLATTYVRDDLGNILSTTDPGGHSTTFNYSDVWANGACTLPGPTYAFATTTTNALGQQVSATFYPCTGLVASQTDPNQQTVSFTYEALNRPYQTSAPDGGLTTVTYNDSALPLSVATVMALTASQNESSTLTFDGLGRTSKTSIDSAPGGPISVDTTYDAVGRKATVNNPHASSSAPTDGTTTFQYDGLSRVIKQIPPDGTAATNNLAMAYVGNCTTITDQAGNQRKSCSDALGRLTQIFEAPNSLNYETDYQYDALGNLLRVDQKGGDTNSANWRTRTFTYDSLSRLLTANNPESGTITYTYDADGNALTKVSPQVNQTNPAVSQTITYCYDVLHRLTRKFYTANSDCINGTGAANYTYDQAAYNGLTIANGIGRRTGMSYGSDVVAWSFDVMGHPTTERRTISSVTKNITYAYNYDGSLRSITYPSGRTVTYTYNTAGQAVSAVDTTSNINYVTTATYASHGAVAGYVIGFVSGGPAGITTTNSYNNRLQPVILSASAPTRIVLSLTYSFGVGTNDNGNVLSITNSRDTSRSVTYTYDELNRIKSATSQATSGANCWGQLFGHMSGSTYVSGYDPWANLKEITVSQCSALALSLSLAPNNRITNTGFSYDAAGNLLADGSNTYTYDAESRIISAAGVTYSYDGDGKRVKKSSGKLYWTGTGSDPLAESDLSGNMSAEYIFFNGKRVARADIAANNTISVVHYYFSDHLGSASVITNADGSVIQDESDYYPFGGERAITASDPNAYKFTGKERDSETGLDYFGARYYGSAIGRFVSPDLFANDTHRNDPQSWNLYAYVRNNSLRYVDPDGEKIYVGDVTGADRDELLKRMNATYGCSGCVAVGSDGYLAVDTSGLNSAVLNATANLTGAINSTEWFAQVKVSNNDTNVAFGETRNNRGAVTWNGVRTNADLIVLDLADNKQVRGDKVAGETFTNTVLAHEILHRFPSAIFDPQGSAAYRIGGPVVDAVNGITSALGLPSRATYSTRPLIQGTSAQTYVSKDPKTGKEQTRIILWQRNIVGGRD